MTDEIDKSAEPGKKKHRALRIAIIAIVALVVVGIGAFAVYVSDYYHADDRAIAALQSTENVQVRTLGSGDIVFESAEPTGPTGPQAGIVFYPGGKAQAEAYAPLMQNLAERGFVSVIVPMPFNLAVLNVDGASGIQEQFPSVRKWILMGHSLGGSMAARYIDGRSGSWDGLVLLASYSTPNLSDDDLDILSIYGSEDGALNGEAYADNRPNLPRDAQEVVIPGGNHAQFGDYGSQAGDGAPGISAEEQQSLVADEIARAFLGE